MNYNQFLSAMKSTALEAGQFLVTERAGLREDEIREKGQGDLVSRIDRTSEEMIRERLLRLLPGSLFMGEEESPDAAAGEWRWIVDPLDGTLNYIQGLPVYAVSIALEHNPDPEASFGEIVAGVIYFPRLKTLYEAVAGGGARKDGQAIHVRKTREISRAVLATGFPFKNRELLTPLMDSFKDLFLRTANIRRIGSAAADLAWVAEGVFDGFWETNLRPWDIAAGELLIREAGGMITDFWGDPVLSTCWPVAGTTLIHPLIMKTVARYFPEFPR